MMRNIFIILTGIVLLGVACSSRERQFAEEIKNLQSRAIRLPSKGIFMQPGMELQKIDINEKGLKLVVYADSIGCTSCAINHIDSWERFIDYAEQFKNQFKYMTKI